MSDQPLDPRSDQPRGGEPREEDGGTVSEAGSSDVNAETSLGGADATLSTPDTNREERDVEEELPGEDNPLIP